MKELNIIEIINIIKRFNYLECYKHGAQADIFALFEIDLKDKDAMVYRCHRIHELFHVDYIEYIPIKYRFDYEFILETYIPMIPYQKNDIIDKFNERYAVQEQYKKRIERMLSTEENKKEEEVEETVNEVETKTVSRFGEKNEVKVKKEERKTNIVMNDTSEEYEDMIQKEENVYNSKRIQYYNLYELNTNQAGLRSSLKMMRTFINRMKKLPKNQYNNIYAIFGLLKGRKAEALRNSWWYRKVFDLTEYLTFRYYKKFFDAPDSDQVYFDHIIDLIVYADEKYLMSEKSKKAYDIYLASISKDATMEVTNDVKEEVVLEEEPGIDLSELLVELEKFYEDHKADKGGFDVFDLFDFDHSLTSEDIKESSRYMALEEIFKNDIDKKNEVHKKLLYYFNSFDNMLSNDEYRSQYEEAVARILNKSISKEKTQIPKVQIDPKINYIIETIISGYKDMKKNYVFLDYYKLFNLNGDATIVELKRDLKLFTLAFNEAYIDGVKDKETYVKLISILDDFSNVILENEETKKKYDDKIRSNTNPLDVVASIMKRYKKMEQEDVFMDYYRLFGLKQDWDFEKLKNKMNYYNVAFQADALSNYNDQEALIKVRELISYFNNSVLENEDTKKKYDGKVKESQNILSFKYTKKKYKIKKKFRNILAPYFQALEKSLIENGAEKTIDIMTDFLTDGLGIENSCFAKLAYCDSEKIRKKLVKAFGPKNCLEETVRRSINHYLNRKHTMLRYCIDLTYKAKGIKQTKEAVQYYMLTHNADVFEEGDSYEYGKSDLQSSVRPDMIRLIIGTHYNDLDLLNKGGNEINPAYLSKKIESMIEQMIKKNHPVRAKLKMLKK